MKFQSTFALALCASASLALSIPKREAEAASEQLFTLELAPGETKQVTEAEKWELHGARDSESLTPKKSRFVILTHFQYLVGLSTLIGGYMWFLYHNREVSYRSAMNFTISRRQQKLYQAKNFDLRKWEVLIDEGNALRKEIKAVANEYDVEWDELQDENSEKVSEALKKERKKKKKEAKDDKDDDEPSSGKTESGGG